MFLTGFECWRHSRQLQDELLETLEAGLGAEDVNLATLRGSWMVYWLAGWPQGPQELRGYAQQVGKHRSRALLQSTNTACCYNQTANYKLHKLHYIGYNTASYQNCKNCKLQICNPGFNSRVPQGGRRIYIYIYIDR